MGTIRLFTNPRQALVWMLLIGAVVFFLQMSFLPALTFLGVGLLLFPLLMLLVIALGGIIPAFFSLVLILLASRMIYGNGGLWLAVYLLPVSAAFVYCLERQLPFFKTCGVLIAAMVTGMMVVFIMLQREAGGNLYEALAKAAIEGLDQFPQRDNLLYTFWRGGLLSHGQEMGAQVFDSTPSGGWTFKPEVVEEFYKQISTRVTALAAGLLPGLLTNFSIILSAAGSGLAIKLGTRYSTAPSLAMPPFSKWFIPKAYGRKMTALALGYLVTILSTNPVLMVAGQLMFNVFSALYVLQGLAYLNFTMKRRGTRPVTRFLLLLLLFVLLSPAAMFIGIYDQFADPRRLRTEQVPPLSA